MGIESKVGSLLILGGVLYIGYRMLRDPVEDALGAVAEAGGNVVETTVAVPESIWAGFNDATSLYTQPIRTGDWTDQIFQSAMRFPVMLPITTGAFGGLRLRHRFDQIWGGN